MPKVPEQQSPLLNTSYVPGAQLPSWFEARGEGRDIEQAGDRAESAFSNIADVQNRIAEIQDRADTQKQHQQFAIESDQMHDQLKAQSPDGYVHDPSTADAAHPAGLVVYDDQGNPKTIATAYNEWAQDRIATMKSEMKTPRAQRFFQALASNTAAEGTITAQHSAMQLHLKAVDQGFSDMVNNAQQMMVSNPDLNQAYAQAQNLQLYLKQQGSSPAQPGMEWPPSGAVGQMTKDMQNGIAKSVMQGAWTQEILNQNVGGKHVGAQQIAVNKWLQILNGTDPDSVSRNKRGLPTIASMLEPQQRAEEIMKLESFKDTAKKNDIATTNLGVANTVNGFKSGWGMSGNAPLDMNELMTKTLPSWVNILDAEVASGARHPGDAIEQSDNILGAGLIGISRSQDKFSSDAVREAHDNQRLNFAVEFARAHAEKMAAQYPDQAFALTAYAGGTLREKLAADLAKARQDDRNAFIKDPAAYVGASDPQHPNALYGVGSTDMHQFIQLDVSRLGTHAMTQYSNLARKAFQKEDQLGSQASIPMDKMKYLPTADSGLPNNAGAWAQTMTNPQRANNEQAFTNFRNFSRVMGNRRSQVLDQMIQEKVMSPEFALLAHVSPNTDPETGKMIMSAMRTPKSAADAMIGGQLANDGISVSQFEQGWAKHIEPYIESLQNSMPLSAQGANFAKAITENGANLAKEFYSRGNLSADQAQEMAYQVFVGKNVHVLPTGEAGWTGHADGWSGTMHENSQVAIPKVLQDGTQISDQDAANIVHFMANWATEENLSKMHLAVPKGATPDQSENFAAYVASHHPRTFTFYDPHTAQEMAGVRYEDDAGHIQTATLDSAGTQPAGVPLKQILRYNNSPKSAPKSKFSLHDMMEGIGETLGRHGF